MKPILSGMICDVLSVMPPPSGAPMWHGDAGDTLTRLYGQALARLPDEVGEAILEDVDTHFGQRPDTKELRDWAATLRPVAAFTPPHLVLVTQGAERPPGILRDGTVAGPGVACGTRPGSCPPYIKARIEAFSRSKQPMPGTLGVILAGSAVGGAE